MSDASTVTAQNRLLSALPAEDFKRLAPHLKPVSLRLSEILFYPDDLLEDVYFPTTAIVSLLTELEDGHGVEVGLVGGEGMVGLSAVLGGTETKVATVQGSGEALRMKADVLRGDFRGGGNLQAVLLGYVHAHVAQISQSVACNSRHPLEGRLARWLLMYHDRVGRDEFFLTQEFIANMLGVRRAGVSEVAKQLQLRGLIDYNRGQITVVDREGLEDITCECYGEVRQKFDEFLLL